MNLLGNIMVLVGSLFCLVSAIAMVRFPDAYARLHASTKCLTAGGLLLFAGVGFQNPGSGFAPRLILLGVLFCLSSPVANHAVARAMYVKAIAEPRIVVDEYRLYLSEKEGGK